MNLDGVLGRRDRAQLAPSRRMRAKFLREVGEARLFELTGETDVVKEADVAGALRRNLFVLTRELHTRPAWCHTAQAMHCKSA